MQELKTIVEATKRSRSQRSSPPGGGQESPTDIKNDERISAKIRSCCAFARTMGYRYLWIDSCCIDKTSSAELSEAINSMYEWYACAAVCFAFLEDVGDDQDPAAKESDFRRSRWFRRGWTLQELIAPQDVLFLSMNWHMLGTKEDLADAIEEITGVDRAVLLFEKTLDSVSVARRMSWASKRITTRVEDEAYALLGIFGICMPTIYGEGRNAFLRLQEEILRTIPDQTIFVWGSTRDSIIDESEWYDLPRIGLLGGGTARSVTPHGRLYVGRGATFSIESHLLADTPSLFSNSSNFSPVPISSLVGMLSLQLHSPQYTITSYGVRTKLPIITWKGLEGPITIDMYLAVLACQDDKGHLVALILRKNSLDNYDIGMILPGYSTYSARAVLLHASLKQILAQPAAITATDVCVTHRTTAFKFQPRITSAPLSIGSVTRAGWDRNFMFRTPCTIFIPKWILSQLGDAGCIPTSVSDGDLFIVGPPKASACTITFAIPRATLRFSVSLSQCTAPQDKAYFLGAGFLHAALAYWDERETGHAEPTVLADCAAEHVVDWEGAARTWDVPGAGPITLRFKNWPCGESESESAIVQPLFALEVHVPLACGDDQSQSSIS